MDIYIFGAHSRAKTLWIYLHEIYPNFILRGYLVNNDEVNPNDIDGIPVIHIDNDLVSELDVNARVYLGIRGIGHIKATSFLKSLGFGNIVPVTPELDIQLRNQFLQGYFDKHNMDFNKMVDAGRECNIYVIRSAYDKPLESDYIAQNNEVELQVGAELTDVRLKSLVKLDLDILYDNVGDNISSRNKQFCELTGLYWVWKNRCGNDDSIVGFEHYRRHFLLPDDWQLQMIENDVDVILPTPLYVHPSLKDDYKERHRKEVLDYVFEWMENEVKNGNDKYNIQELTHFFSQPLYTPCNMFITKVGILKELCAWLFPILFAVESRFGELEDTYQNRYPGFVAERLISYYFMDREKDFEIMYADKNFLF